MGGFNSVSRSYSGLISASCQAHIMQRHGFSANSGSNTSHFNRLIRGKTLENLVEMALKNGTVQKSKNGQGRLTHQYKFTESIGKDGSGKTAYRLRVVSDGRGHVITAFPV